MHELVLSHLGEVLHVLISIFHGWYPEITHIVLKIAVYTPVADNIAVHLPISSSGGRRRLQRAEMLGSRPKGCLQTPSTTSGMIQERLRLLPTLSLKHSRSALSLCLSLVGRSPSMEKSSLHSQTQHWCKEALQLPLKPSLPTSLRVRLELSIHGEGLSQQGNQPPNQVGAVSLNPLPKIPVDRHPDYPRGLVLSALKGSNRLDKNFPSDLHCITGSPFPSSPGWVRPMGGTGGSGGERESRVLVSWPSFGGIAVRRPHPLLKVTAPLPSGFT